MGRSIPLAYPEDGITPINQDDVFKLLNAYANNNTDQNKQMSVPEQPVQPVRKKSTQQDDKISEYLSELGRKINARKGKIDQTKRNENSTRLHDTPHSSHSVVQCGVYKTKWSDPLLRSTYTLTLSLCGDMSHFTFLLQI